MTITPISVADAVASLELLPNRTPGMDPAEAASRPQWANQVTPYRDGGMFAVYYAGVSEWERHGAGDEVVMVLEGATTMTLIVDGAEERVALAANQLVIVPQNTWHRFETPEPSKIMTITPQPTDHQVAHPLGSTNAEAP